MTYSYDKRRQIRKAIRKAEENDTITKTIKARLQTAESLAQAELDYIRSLLKKPLV